MNTIYGIAKYIVSIEFGLILLTIIITLFLKLFFFGYDKKKKD